MIIYTKVSDERWKLFSHRCVTLTKYHHFWQFIVWHCLFWHLCKLLRLPCRLYTIYNDRQYTFYFLWVFFPHVDRGMRGIALGFLATNVHLPYLRWLIGKQHCMSAYWQDGWFRKFQKLRICRNEKTVPFSNGITKSRLSEAGRISAS